jgi:hypothetical protein
MFNQNNLFFMAIILVCTLTSACGSQQVAIQDTGEMVVQELELSGFEEIEVSHKFDVEIVQGENFRVVVETEESLIPYLEIVSRGKTLKIGLKSEYEYTFENATQRVEVTIPDLTRLESTNKSSVSIQDFNTLGEIKMQVSDFSSLAGNLQADSIQVEINRHSSVNISGIAQEVTGNIAGQSTINLSTFDCQSITIVADQHSQVKE